MPCKPTDNEINPPVYPNLPIPGLGFPFSPIQVPVPNFKFPENFPDSILEALDKIFAIFPSGTFLPQVDNFGNDILKFLASVFNQIAPFLSIYNFFTSLLNMILCIIDVLCALPKPRKTIKAVKRLIKTCLPPFLNLFPWLALLAMILAFLLLLLALIEYIINRLLAIIEDLLANLLLLGNANTLTDTEAAAAIAIKIASLLCILDNLFAVFSAIGAIIAIFQALSQISGRRFCNKGGGDCCGEDVCPNWISLNPNGLTGNLGKLVYNRKYTATISGFNRQERWEFVNDENATYPFKSIITSVDGGDIFWPESISYSNETLPQSAPYTVNMTLKNFDPTVFIPSDTDGVREFEIQDVIVSIKPYLYTYDYLNERDTSNTDGTLNLVGGKVYSVSYTDAGEKILTPYLINGVQATIENFIHKFDRIEDNAPSTDDRTEIENIEFTMAINHPVLLDHNLITYGCVPELAAEAEFLNNLFDIRSVEDKLGGAVLPDITGAQACLSQAMADLRKDVSVDNVNAAKTKILDCLLNLRLDTTDKICALLKEAVSPYNSTFTADPEIQFTTREIGVDVELKDVNNTLLSTNIPPECSGGIASLLRGEVTLGSITQFEYNIESSTFQAKISSAQAGDGQLRVYFNNNMFKTVKNRDNVDAETTFEDLVVNYTFIGASTVAPDPQTRRDSSDVADS